jgi:hypothetical protein
MMRADELFDRDLCDLIERAEQYATLDGPMKNRWVDCARDLRLARARVRNMTRSTEEKTGD